MARSAELRPYRGLVTGESAGEWDPTGSCGVSGARAWREAWVEGLATGRPVRGSQVSMGTVVRSRVLPGQR